VQPAIVARRAGEPFTAGMRFPDLVSQTTTAVERGYRVAVHAMGNAGLDAALDAFAATARRNDSDHRFRVEHVSLAAPAQLRRMAELGAVGVVQPGFLDALGSRIAGLSFEDATWMPFASLQEAGVPMAGSSDDPCGDWEPLRVSTQGVSRRTPRGEAVEPQESVSYEDWLRAYTIGAAYAGGQEAERGTITPGKRADLVVLEGALDPERPPTVVETWVAGERRPRLKAP
jgi:predicted amidohydrolase YtcJ